MYITLKWKSQIEKMEYPAILTTLVIPHNFFIVHFITTIKVIKNILFHFTFMPWYWWQFCRSCRGIKSDGRRYFIIWKVFWINLVVFAAVCINQATRFLKKSPSEDVIRWFCWFTVWIASPVCDENPFLVCGNITVCAIPLF